MMGRDHDNYECEAKMDELRAENERLKVGLKVIAQLEPVCGDSDSNWSKLERAAELARKALREAGCG